MSGSPLLLLVLGLFSFCLFFQIRCINFCFVLILYCIVLHYIIKYYAANFKKKGRKFSKSNAFWWDRNKSYLVLVGRHRVTAPRFPPSSAFWNYPSKSWLWSFPPQCSNLLQSLEHHCQNDVRLTIKNLILPVKMGTWIQQKKKKVPENRNSAVKKSTKMLLMEDICKISTRYSLPKTTHW